MVQRLLCLLLFATTAGASEVTRVGRWELHSSFWMNLHQTLMHDAAEANDRDTGGWPAEERAAWEASVAAYREARGRGNIFFAGPMLALQDSLTQVADDAVKMEVAGPLADALRRAAPVYRARWWPSHDAANRFSIGYTAAMLRDAGEELVLAHEAVYGEKYPPSIRVDFSGYAGQFGAYTISSDYVGTDVTISSLDAGYHGLAVLEAVLHESSHSVVFPSGGRVGRAIADASKRAGVQPPRDLWHAILFATTSELTRRALARRGAPEYVPFSADLLTRAWPRYREAIEQHWYAYLSGSGTLEEAVDKIVAAVK